MIQTEPIPLDTAHIIPDEDKSIRTSSESLVAPLDFALERPDLEKIAKKLVPAEEHNYAPFVVRRYATESSGKPAVTCLDWSTEQLDKEKIQKDFADSQSRIRYNISAAPFWLTPLIASETVLQHPTPASFFGAIGVAGVGSAITSAYRGHKKGKELSAIMQPPVSNPDKAAVDVEDKSHLIRANSVKQTEKRAALKAKYTYEDKNSLGRAIRGEAMAFSDKTVKHEAIVLDSPLQVFGADVPPNVALELLTHLSIGISGSQSSETNDNQFDVSVRTGDVVCGSLDLVKDPGAFIADNFDRLWDISISEGAIGTISHNQRFTRLRAGESDDGQLEDPQILLDTVTQSHLYDVLQVGCNVYEDICMQVQSLLDDYVVLNPDTAVAKAWVDSKEEHLPNRIAAIGPSFLNEAVPDYMQYEGYPLPDFLRRIARVFGRSGGTLEAERLQEGTSSGVRFN